MLAPRFPGLFQHIVERGLLLALGCGALALLRGGVVVVGHLHARLLGQLLHRLAKAQPGVVHQKADGVAVLATAKAVKELFGRADAERRRFLPVEGAQAHVVGARLLELHVAAHHIDDVGAREEILDE
ncbi:hypothetical protein SDC9_122745 [bioreactor metagenome]|uniref:Uncharacterized protein n=1 Tax=bioreactor metagenome TaxID=1076179 RepID=A0A645CFS5_9ZZZZ